MIPGRFKILLASDILISGSYGLIMPLLPLFMTDRLSGANLQTVAMAQAIYLLSQAGFGWIYSTYQQHKQPTHRAYEGLVTGSAIIALVPIAYLSSREMTHIFLAQIALGLGFGLVYPAWAWLAKEQIADKHVNSIRKMHSLILSLAMAFMAVLGGFIAYQFGYADLLYLMTVLAACGTVLSLGLWLNHER